MKTIQQRRLEILEWERDNRNFNNRSYEKYKGCTYSGEVGCAVGRLIEDKDLCAELDKSPEPQVMDQFYNFPKNVQELGWAFLSDLQNLHDNPYNWDDIGLSPSGLYVWNNIVEKYTKDI
jgi:hypothetical protein